MGALTPAQCRAARALLDMQQRELAAKSKVSKKTIADFERGLRSPYPRTLEDLRRTFEEVGIQFLDAVESGDGVGVRIRAGFQEITRTATGEGRSNSGEGGVEAHSWEDFDDFTSDQPVVPYIIPISDSDRAILRQRFAECPEAWNKLSDRAKAVYSRELNI
jgi:transcriptional regulator with XRE-family HTH domain